MINSSSESSTFRSETDSASPLDGVDAGTPKAIAVRVPIELVRRCRPLIVGEGCPSWGQLAVWTCEDRSPEVMAQMDEALRRRSRVPRGVIKGGLPKVGLTPHLTDQERGVLDVIVHHYRSTHGTAANRSAVFVAALRVASRHPDDYRRDGAQPTTATDH